MSVVIDMRLPFQALPYVCLLIAMLFFIYAIIGMQVSKTVHTSLILYITLQMAS